MEHDFLSLTIISKQWTPRSLSIPTQYDEQVSNTLSSLCTLLHVQAYNLSWRNGNAGKGAGGKNNMFSSLKYLFFLKTLPKARKLTGTKMNNKKNEGHWTLIERAITKLPFPKVKRHWEQWWGGTQKPSHHCVIRFIFLVWKHHQCWLQKQLIFPAQEIYTLGFWVGFFLLLAACITMVLLH